MTTRQKLFSGFGFLLLGLSLALINSHKTYAANANDIGSATVKAINAGTLTLTIGGKDFDFVDGDPTDHNATFTGKVDDCGGGKITFPDGHHQIDFGGRLANLNVTVEVQVKPGSGSCQATTPAKRTIAVDSPANAYAFFNWVSQDTLQNLKGNKNYKLDPASGQYIDTSGSQCQDRIIVTPNGRATFYELDATGSQGIDAKNFPEIADNAKGCFVIDINYHGRDYKDGNPLCPLRPTTDAARCDSAQTISSARNMAGDRMSLAGSATDPVTGVSSTLTQPTCESSNHSGFEWLFCGVLGAVDDIINELGDIIEGQLVFDTSNDFGDDQGVRQAWAALKNIATVMVVIVALVMVISQIVSWGPFDAYTIRRVLPRLIIAIIAIQLSWYLLSWFIELANDAGQGIANLLYAPFGGRHALSFATLLDNNVGAGTSTGLFTLAAVGVGVGVAVMNIFGIAALAISAFAAIFIGFLVLIFRKILIIMCVILAPIAIICWVLPNTQKYWKLWHETFSKLLIMFPLVVALIASGRIFAHVAGGSDINDITTFFLIVVGFFGPFFILPKTFQWGGRALGTISGITNDRSKGMFDKSRNFLGERQKQRKVRGKREGAYNLRTPGSYNGIRGGLRRGVDLARTGSLDPTRRSADPFEADKHELELDKLALSQRTHGTRHEAERAALAGQERKEALAFATTQAQNLGRGDPALAEMATNPANTTEQRIAAITRMLEVRDFATVERLGLNRTADYAQAWQINSGLFGSVGTARPDLQPIPQESGVFDATGAPVAGMGPGTIADSVGARTTQDAPNWHTTYWQKAAFGTEATPEGGVATRSAASASTALPTDTVLQGSHQQAMQHINTLAGNDNTATTLFGGEKQQAVEFILRSDSGARAEATAAGIDLGDADGLRQYVDMVQRSRAAAPPAAPGPGPTTPPPTPPPTPRSSGSTGGGTTTYSSP